MDLAPWCCCTSAYDAGMKLKSCIDEKRYSIEMQQVQRKAQKLVVEAVNHNYFGKVLGLSKQKI